MIFHQFAYHTPHFEEHGRFYIGWIKIFSPSSSISISDANEISSNTLVEIALTMESNYIERARHSKTQRWFILDQMRLLSSNMGDMISRWHALNHRQEALEKFKYLMSSKAKWNQYTYNLYFQGSENYFLIKYGRSERHLLMKLSNVPPLWQKIMIFGVKSKPHYNKPMYY